MSEFVEVKSEVEKLSGKYPQIRPIIIESMLNYVFNRLHPGSFVQSVLENNLMESFGRADIVNRATLFEITSFVYNDLPGSCHGSEEIVTNWLRGDRT